MIRTIGLITSFVMLTGCGGDGRGSQYSSARANTSPVNYVPVTPGARPVSSNGARGLSGPIVGTPGAPVGGGQAQARVVRTTALTPAPTPEVKFATGPIYSACLGAARNGATRSRCGCVQWVADRQLSASQQRQGARYFDQQHDLQEIRQSDSQANEEFWTAWRAFGANAGDICRGT